jgi:thiamine biosynthesis lipoprotein
MTLAGKQMPGKTITGLLKRASFLVYVVCALLLSGCDSGPEIIKISGTKMGTTYHVTLVADQPAPDDLAERIDQLLNVVDQSMSTYREDSEISVFNQTPPDQQQTISNEFAQVLRVSQQVWQQTDGAFDPTVGPLVDLWGFGPVRTDDEVPDDRLIQSALEDVGFDFLVLDESTLTKTKPLRLDLSAVAKGYAVDQVADLLESLALPDYLVEVGGELRASGSNPEGQSWRVAIETPTLMSQIQNVVAVHDAAVATSGDYRNYFERDGVRYSHTIDPRTGRPITHRLGSVTVIAKTCAEADAWATALMVLGEEEGMALANRHSVAVYMLVRDNNDFQALSSDAFINYMHDAEESAL